MPENEQERPTVSMTIWKEERGGERRGEEGGGGDGRRGEERSTRSVKADVMCTTAALRRAGSRSESKHPHHYHHHPYPHPTYPPLPTLHTHVTDT